MLDQGNDQSPALTWPTADKLKRVRKRVASATIALDELDTHGIGPIAHDYKTTGGENVLAPNDAEFAALSRFLAVVESDVETMQRWVDEIRETRDNGAFAAATS